MVKPLQHPRRPSDRPAPKVRPDRSGPVTAEIISIGRELLNGRVVDTNAGTLARLLSRRGVAVRRITTVGNDQEAIATSLLDSLGRNRHLVVLTGGLGPAAGDRTLAAVSQALSLPLTLDRQARSMVEAAYQRKRQERAIRKGGLTAAREKMCMIPVGGTAVENPIGIAPGVFCRLAGGAGVLCLPGLPGDAEAVFEAALGELKLPEADHGLARREIESPTVDEAALRPLLDQLTEEFPEVWIQSRPSAGKVMVGLEATGENQQAANATVDGVVRRLLALAAGSP